MLTMSRKWYEVIRDRRIERQLTPGELARAVGLSRPAILKIESGETRYPRYETIAALCAFLDLDAATLFRDARDGPPASEGDAVKGEALEKREREAFAKLEAKFGTERALELVRGLSSLDIDQVDHVDALIDSLSSKAEGRARGERKAANQ